jgi:Flp pilus assembly protein TadD
MAEEDTYDRYRRGMDLLQRGDFHAALIQLGEVRQREPDKDSVREAYGRALFGTQRLDEAAEEFAAVAEHDPTNHYALFCLGRSLQQLGRHEDARAPLTQALHLAPDRDDYRRYLAETLKRSDAA